MSTHTMSFEGFREAELAIAQEMRADTVGPHTKAFVAGVMAVCIGYGVTCSAAEANKVIANLLNDLAQRVPA